jgi:hypothetical protein
MPRRKLESEIEVAECEIKMEEAFTQDDWLQITDRVVAVSYFLRQKKCDVNLFRALPPVEKSQVGEFQRKTGLRFERDFQDFVKSCAGGWRFSLSLFLDNKSGPLEPPVKMGTFGGNSNADFIGASENFTLLQAYEEFQTIARDSYIENEETLAILPALFPLQLSEGGGADFTVLRLDMKPAEVHFLSHDEDYALRENSSLLARGFRQFLLRWSSLGFLSLEHVGAGEDDPVKTRAWWDWLSDPTAR